MPRGNPRSDREGRDRCTHRRPEGILHRDALGGTARSAPEGWYVRVTRSTRLPWAREVDSRGRMTNPETEIIMRPIREVCKRLHLPCERNATGKARSLGGTSIIHLHSTGYWELEVYVPGAGCSIMIECKMAGKGLSPEQAAWAKVYRAGGKEMVVAARV